MKKNLILSSYTILLITGLLQFLLLPGLIWNLLFPVAPLILIICFVLSKKLKSNRYARNCTGVLIILMILEMVFNIYTDTNIKSPDKGKEITVMSYNLFFKNRTHNSSLALIKKHNPDLLVVQELTPKWESILNQKLSKSHPYKLTKALRGTHGIGIYSKHKLSDHELINNQSSKPYAQIGTLKIGDRKIQIINTHLASPAIAVENPDRFFKLYATNYQLRKSQLDHLSQLAKKDSENFSAQILAGDLNTLKYEPIFKKNRLYWTNSFSNFLSLSSQNFPNSSKTPPLVMLDYIMGHGAIKFIESQVIQGGSSDHMAIITKAKI